jgi:hypothetical protein
MFSRSGFSHCPGHAKCPGGLKGRRNPDHKPRPAMRSRTDGGYAWRWSRFAGSHFRVMQLVETLFLSFSVNLYVHSVQELHSKVANGARHQSSDFMDAMACANDHIA